MSVVRNKLLVRVALVLVEAEDHQAQANANLGRGQAYAIRGVHGLVHIGDDRPLGEIMDILNRPRHLQKSRIAHFQYLTDHARLHSVHG
jgi:hypothetical protein